MRATRRPNDLRIGFHVSISPSPLRVFERISERGIDTIQIFTKSPRTWAAPTLDLTLLAAFRHRWQEAGHHPLVAHASYLLNLSAENATVRQQSITALRQEIGRAHVFGAEYIVLHIGHHSCPVKRVSRMVDGLNEMWRGLRPTLTAHPGLDPEHPPMLLLENTARRQETADDDLRELAAVRAGLDFPCGVCLDTCHAFQSGHDLSTATGRRSWVTAITRHLGTGIVRVIHLNDSLRPCGTGVDRHAGIGAGEIGASALGTLLLDPFMRGMPIIMETPGAGEKDPSTDLKNLATLTRALTAARRAKAPQ